MTQTPSSPSGPLVARQAPSFSPFLEGYGLAVQRFCAPWGSTDTQITVGRRMLLGLANKAFSVQLHPPCANPAKAMAPLRW